MDRSISPPEGWCSRFESIILVRCRRGRCRCRSIDEQSGGVRRSQLLGWLGGRPAGQPRSRSSRPLNSMDTKGTKILASLSSVGPPFQVELPRLMETTHRTRGSPASNKRWRTRFALFSLKELNSGAVTCHRNDASDDRRNIEFRSLEALPSTTTPKLTNKLWSDVCSRCGTERECFEKFFISGVLRNRREDQPSKNMAVLLTLGVDSGTCHKSGESDDISSGVLRTHLSAHQPTKQTHERINEKQLQTESEREAAYR